MGGLAASHLWTVTEDAFGSKGSCLFVDHLNASFPSRCSLSRWNHSNVKNPKMNFEVGSDIDSQCLRQFPCRWNVVAIELSVGTGSIFTDLRNSWIGIRTALLRGVMEGVFSTLVFFPFLKLQAIRRGPDDNIHCFLSDGSILSSGYYYFRSSRRLLYWRTIEW